MNAILVGAAGEKAACNYLKKNKYKILDKNYRKPFGEIDLIARRGETVSFIEVKTRRSIWSAVRGGDVCQASATDPHSIRLY